MDDLIKPNVASAAPEVSESNAREVAFSLSFDQAALESLESGKKKRRAMTAPVEATEPIAKKPKVAEVEGVDPVLLELRLKKNEARAITKQATSEESELLAAGPFALKHKAAAEEKKQKQVFEQKLAEAGVDPARYARLHETQEAVDAALAKTQRRGAEDVSILGPGVTQYASSFDRRARDVVHDKEAYEAQKQAMGDDFYAESSDVVTFQADSERVDAMVSELHKQDSKRREFSRRRTFKEEKDITFINEANRRLNKQLDKHYGKATAAIKDSLERGTAL